MFKQFIFSLLLFSLLQNINAQLVINEVMSSNNSIIADEDGSNSDWIELYNGGNEAINLAGYGITDNLANHYKWIFPDYTIGAGEYLLVWASSKNRKPVQNGMVNGLIREMYQNIPGTSVDDLLANPNYPNNPNTKSLLKNSFEAPSNIGENYGQRVYALFIPPFTGNYQFNVSGDDNTRLYLSTDDSPANVKLIAEVPGWTNPREWDKYSTQTSSSIPLIAGNQYYIMCLMKEAFGGDHLAVRYRLPGNSNWQSPMGTEYLWVEAGELHTNFSISSGGEPIRLTDPSGNMVDFIDVPALPTNISIGRSPNGTGEFKLFEIATPGKQNIHPGFDERLGKPVIAQKAGIYANVFSTAITHEDVDAEIFYTINGSVPSRTNGIKYQNPIPVNGAFQIRAVATKAGFMTSEIAAATYNVNTPNLPNFNSNLPLMIINQFDTIIGADEKTTGYMTLIDKANGDNRYYLNATNGENYRIDIDIRGSSSQSFPKKGYGFHILNEDNSNRKEALFGMPSEHNWVLHGPYSDKSLLRNDIAYELARDMGNYTPRTQFVELFLHDGSGTLSPAQYHGVYLLVERIKIAPGRLELAELEPHHDQLPEISGGYIFKKDRLGSGEEGFRLHNGSRFAFVRPKEEEITPAQRDWLKNYLDDFDRTLKGPNFKDPQIGYKKFIDENTFIDYHLITELTKQIDGYRLSTFLHKDRNGKLKLGPIWDYNLSWGNADYNNGWLTDGWYYPVISEDEYLVGWFNRLFQDEDFAKKYKERYTKLRRDVFSEDHIIGKLRHKESMIKEASVRNFQRWQVMGTYVWPNWYIAPTHDAEIDWMEDWMRKRLKWMDGQLLVEIQEDSLDLIHYWSFNNTANYLEPSFTVNNASMSVSVLSGGEVLTGTGQNFNAANARFGDQAASHLRVNNPIGSTVELKVSSKRYKDLLLKYETRRSGSGANRQYLSYAVDGVLFQRFDTLIVTESPDVYRYDFKALESVNNQSNLTIRIEIDQAEDGSGGNVGNNRFDNITLEGTLLPDINLPPIVSNEIGFTEVIAEFENPVIDIQSVFSDPEGDNLSFSIDVQPLGFVEAILDNGTLQILGRNAGSVTVTLSANDGTNADVSTSFNLLIYPTSCTVIDHQCNFDSWSKDEKEYVYPGNMIFLQSNVDDPGLSDELRFAYYIPHNDYAAADAANVGFPYKNTSRTRIDALEDDGISFVNTGRGRDLGAAVMHLSTQGADSLFISFKAGTVRPNSRVYHLRLQYRDGLSSDWTDFTDVDGNIIEYKRNHQEGHDTVFTDIQLPTQLLDKESIFLRWKHYFTGERLDMASGARDILRLDDILVSDKRISSVKDNVGITETLKIWPNPTDGSMLFFSKVISGHVVNATGVLVRSISNQDNLIIGDLPSGIYYVRTTAGETAKLVVIQS